MVHIDSETAQVDPSEPNSIPLWLEEFPETPFSLWKDKDYGLLRCYQCVRSRLFEGEPELFCDWGLKNNLFYLKNKSLIEHKLIHRTSNIFMGLSTKLKYDASLKFVKKHFIVVPAEL